MLICVFIQRTKIHKIMGIHFESHSGSNTPMPVTPKDASLSGGTSLDLKQEFDLESQVHRKGTGSPESDGDPDKTDAERTDAEDSNNKLTTPPSEGQQTIAQRRRISKRPSRTYARPEDLVIAVPGQDSEPEDSVHAKKSKDAQKATANLSRRNSVASARSRRSGRPSSVHSATTTYTTVSVTTEGGRTRRRLSKRRGRTEYRGSVMGGYESDDSYRSRRRLSKAPSVRSRPSASLNRYWSANEDLDDDRKSRRGRSEGRRPGSIISVRGRDRSVNNVGRSGEVQDDPTSKYHWDPERGWIEHGSKRK
jgi:hypothetical protein